MTDPLDMPWYLIMVSPGGNFYRKGELGLFCMRLKMNRPPNSSGMFTDGHVGPDCRFPDVQRSTLNPPRVYNVCNLFVFILSLDLEEVSPSLPNRTSADGSRLKSLSIFLHCLLGDFTKRSKN